GFRGHPAVDLAALEKLLLQVSALAEAHPEIKELDLNPVFAYTQGCLAVDARVVLHAEGTLTAPRPLSAATRAALQRAFNPRAVAVIGDQRAMNYMRRRTQKTFHGEASSVQRHEDAEPG